MYAFPGLYMPRVGSRQASLNKLIWCTLLCYLLCSGDKIHLFVIHNDDICPEDHILKYRLLDMYVKPHNNGLQISLMFISLSAGSMRVFCDY